MISLLRRISGFFAFFRWLFMPVGLLALIAVGVHAAADVVDDRLLVWVEGLDVWLDGYLAQSERFAAWVLKVDARERTVIARVLAVSWELAVDALIAVPALGYDEDAGARASLRAVLTRLNQAPTVMRTLRPIITGIFVVGGAYAVSKLVESTLFVALVGKLSTPDSSAAAARIAGLVAMLTVLVSHGWRAVVRALQHADDAAEARRIKKQRVWSTGLMGTALALPLAVALLLQARALLSLVL